MLCSSQSQIPKRMTQRFSFRHSCCLLDDCPICLDPMVGTDEIHPLQCSNHCGYNFCKNCIESLITSSKDDYMEASDGNRHVKVFLHCPNCRSDLSDSIRDTLLLRKVGALHLKPEHTMTESETKLWEAMDTTTVKEAIRRAREREDAYLATDVSSEEEDEDSSADEGKIAAMIDHSTSWGVEADLLRGAHESFHVPSDANNDSRKSFHEEAVKIDPTLFAGLDFFLTDDQRLKLTQSMTSGEPDQLAQSALFLHTTVRNHVRCGGSGSKARSPTSPRLSRRSSVYDLITEANASRVNKEEEKKQIEDMSHLEFLGQRNHKMDLRRQAQFMKQFPLPVRLPKAAEVDMTRPLQLEFLDYEWDGTVMDAYSKLSIGFLNHITQKKTENMRVRSILGINCGDVRVELPGQKRVLVKRMGSTEGKQGVVRGDVLTHLDGESLANKTVNEVLLELQKKMLNRKVLMIFNAERSVAEALKRRAFAISEM